MKIDLQVEIAAPYQFVSDIFRVSENKKHWHPELLAIEPVTGTPGQVGSVAKLKFKKFEILETVTVNALPDEFSGEYLTPKICWNSMSNKFIPINEERTRYQVEVNYRFIGNIVKIMAFLMPWMFRNQIRKSISQFKSFVELEYAKTERGA